MNANIVPSTPLPVPGINEPRDFLRFLNNVNTDHLADHRPRISADQRQDWVTIAEGLIDHFLKPIPLPDITTWKNLSERVLLLDATLECVGRMLRRVDDIFDHSERFVRTLVVRSLDLYNVLEAWVDVAVENGEEEEEGDLVPAAVRKKALGFLLDLLVGLDAYTMASPGQTTNSRDWLRDIVLECVAVCRDAMAAVTSTTVTVTLSFFGTPRVKEQKTDDALTQPQTNPFDIILPVSRFPAFLVSFLEVIAQVPFSHLRCKWHLFDVSAKIPELSREMYELFLNPGSPMTLATRSKSISRLVDVMEGKDGRSGESACHVLEHLLRLRLDGEPKLDWLVVDQGLVMALNRARGVLSPSKGFLDAILQKLGSPVPNDLDGMKEVLLTYFAAVYSRSDENVRRSLKELAQLLGPNPAQTLFHEELERHSEPLFLPATAPEGSLKRSSHRWKQELFELVQAIVSPSNVDWMDDDGNFSTGEYCQRALYDVQAHFERDDYGLSTEDRIRVIDLLLKLPCLISQCDSKGCSQAPYVADLRTQPYTSVLSRLLEGTEAVEVKQHVFKLLGAIVKHHAAGDASASFESVLLKGMQDADRNVRISAGKVMGDLVEAYSTLGKEGATRVDDAFIRLYQQLEISKNHVKETLVVNVGSIGRTTGSEILGQVVCLLIAQLGKQNIVIKALACTQILALSKFHKKSPYALTLPYMHKIAPYIITHLHQAHLLPETCHLLSINPADFFSRTLPLTLPLLFATCDDKVLDYVSKEVNSSPSHLFVKHPREVVSYILLLPNQASVSKGLAFTAKTLSDAANSTITLQNICKMCLVPLIAELVFMSGDENATVGQQAILAIRRVDSIMVTGKPIPHRDDIGEFLKTQMLGVISDINDMLRDVHGRKSVKDKQKIIRGMGVMIVNIGAAIFNLAPQIMAIFQTMVSVPELAQVTFSSWHHFLVTLGPSEMGSHIGPTSAAIVSAWPMLTEEAREIAKRLLEYVIVEVGPRLGKNLVEIVDLSSVPELVSLQKKLKKLRGSLGLDEELKRILDQSLNDNLAVATQALGELKGFMVKQHAFIRKLASGDVFDPFIAQMLSSLLGAASREGEGMEQLRLLAFECLSVLGAVDPDRCDIPTKTSTVVVLKNFTDDAESIVFALHLIQDVLTGAFLSTSDMRFQTEIAYCIQELLKICGFTRALVASGSSSSIPVKVRNRWAALPKLVVETVAPLLEGRYNLAKSTSSNYQHPIYPTQSTYREWLQAWVSHLITKASGEMAQRIFSVFRAAIRNKDVGIARHLLPHLVLNIMISGHPDDRAAISAEVLSVLKDQDAQDSTSTADKRLLSAQAVFMLLDHLNKWVRLARQEQNSKPQDRKRARWTEDVASLDEQIVAVDGILLNLDSSLMANAAFRCKAYARALMNFEQQILLVKEREGGEATLTEYYEKMHEIYANIDEPDGMEGISSLIVSPTLEHQIRQHESTGNWTSAQSCWEVKLQQSPDEVDLHIGLLRCLRNLGHYDTLRTHVRGVLTQHPEWETTLADFNIESAWMVGAWDDVERLVEKVQTRSSSLVMARLLLSMKQGDSALITESLSLARSVLGAPLVAAGGVKGYRRSYAAILDLHLTHELDLIYRATNALPVGSQEDRAKARRQVLRDLSSTLSSRLGATLPTFRSREPILSMRRTAFSLCANTRNGLEREIGRTWLASAKIARKAKQWQTAYSAVLQAVQNGAPFSCIESTKLLKATGEPLRALHELENFMKDSRLFEVVDLMSDPEEDRMKGKVAVLRARWMNEADRFDMTHIYNVFHEAASRSKNSESAYYHLGHFHDEKFRALSLAERSKRGLRMNFYTIKAFSKAVIYGSKYVYQTVPRLLTIWMDVGEDPLASSTDQAKKMSDMMAKVFDEAPVYKWYTAFPQIVSRVGHTNPDVYQLLSKLLMIVMEAYPKQALWMFMAVVKSTKPQREQRGKQILEKLKSTPHSGRVGLAKLINDSLDMTNELLKLCDAYLDGDKSVLNMAQQFPKLKRLGKCDLIIPLQESLIASLPPASTAEDTHQPFPSDAPTFHKFHDEIEVMRSLAKPRKITITGSNGQTYMFLGKPKDDLRKDARLMDFNSIINKLLKGNSESRRRQLHIRTYSVVTLNEECGFIQWVPNTMPIRPVILKYYEARKVKPWSSEMSEVFKKIKESSDKDAAELFKTRILPGFPPVFHEWFLETFPEPTEWLASRLTFARTTAVMSMVGFILGLGDRHSENILLDTNSGDLVHVDFNCLFERGKTLETPERVPFRLTQNIVDGLGVSGVEGVFRTACEVSFQLLRDNKDSLMSVLDAFIHDPLVEWEDEKRRMDRDPHRRSTTVKNTTNMKTLAKSSLHPIEKKLKGIYTTSVERAEREITTTNLVQMLIAEATNLSNLAKMYPGWASWH